jgi:hypothetical protein
MPPRVLNVRILEERFLTGVCCTLLRGSTSVHFPTMLDLQLNGLASVILGHVWQSMCVCRLCHQSLRLS